MDSKTVVLCGRRAKVAAALGSVQGRSPEAKPVHGHTLSSQHHQTSVVRAGVRVPSLLPRSTLASAVGESGTVAAAQLLRHCAFAITGI